MRAEFGEDDAVAGFASALGLADFPLKRHSFGETHAAEWLRALRSYRAVWTAEPFVPNNSMPFRSSFSAAQFAPFVFDGRPHPLHEESSVGGGRFRDVAGAEQVHGTAVWLCEHLHVVDAVEIDVVHHH